MQPFSTATSLKTFPPRFSKFQQADEAEKAIIRTVAKDNHWELPEVDSQKQPIQYGYSVIELQPRWFPFLQWGDLKRELQAARQQVQAFVGGVEIPIKNPRRAFLFLIKGLQNPKAYAERIQEQADNRHRRASFNEWAPQNRAVVLPDQTVVRYDHSSIIV